MARPITVLKLTAGERRELQRRVSSSTSSKRDSLRAEIVLLRSEGVKVEEVAERLNVSLPCVSKWSRRFQHAGLDGLNDKAGRGRKPWVPMETVEQIIVKVTQPPPGRTRWSLRSMAKEVGVSRHTVHTIWKRNDLKPHRTPTFKLSKDPKFEQKFWDVIGLYLHPPEKALVLCCDEKTQCQALERSQPGLPLGIGHIRTRTHDYKRHGTITLFAALNYLDGKLISRTEQRHTHVEWLRFLKQIERETPKSLAIHLIVDNYRSLLQNSLRSGIYCREELLSLGNPWLARCRSLSRALFCRSILPPSHARLRILQKAHSTHKHERVRRWVDRHPRIHCHFTPTGSSWLNLVERFFADLTSDVIRDGSFRSVPELVRAIESYLADRNADPQRYTWHTKGEAILAKIQRAKEALANVN